jgi:hypothetical protein
VPSCFLSDNECFSVQAFYLAQEKEKKSNNAETFPKEKKKCNKDKKSKKQKMALEGA